MHKKISAAFILMLFALTIVATPVQAHFTLGYYKGTYDYHDVDFDPHYKGNNPLYGSVIGYVFPGAGPTGGSASNLAPGVLAGGTSGIPAGTGGISGIPGYQSLYPEGNPGDGAVRYNGPMNWYQAEANSYAPFGAILTSTIKSGTAFNKLFLNENPTINGPMDNRVDALPIEHAVRGDLIFAINWTNWGANSEFQWLTACGKVGSPLLFSEFDIFIPPEFSNIKKENVVASFTNDYGNINVGSPTNVEDSIVPNDWVAVQVRSDSALDGLTTGRYMTFGNQTLGDTWYYIRVNDVVAPTIAGKYFFKMRLTSAAKRTADAMPYCTAPDGNTGLTTAYYWLGTSSPYYGSGYKTDGTPNWPCLLVKGEVDPAYVDGTIRYGGYFTADYYGKPIALPGRVRLVGRAIDPYTLQPTGRPVEARGYFNGTANGHFEVEGVAPGVYDIYASAAGYPEKLIQTGVTILRGQSYHVDCYLTPGPVIIGDVFSKCGTGETNWVTWQDVPGDCATAQDIKIEIFKVGSVPQATGTCTITGAQLEDETCQTETNAVSWSPVTFFGSGRRFGFYPDQFQWPGYGSPYDKGVDSNGVGPLQTWEVLNTKSSFHFQFGHKGLYGVPGMWDGHVPQLNATWVDGLAAGTYETKAFTYGYIQTKADGLTFEHVSFTIPTAEFPGDIYVPWDLRLTNYVKKTVHFHDYPGTLQEITTFVNPNGPVSNVDYYDPALAQNNNPAARYVYVGVANDAGVLQAWKVSPNEAYLGTGTPGKVTSGPYSIFLRGFRAQTDGGAGSGNGWGRNYGIESGTYTVKAYMMGFVEQTFEKVTVGLCGSEIAISDHLYRGAGFNITYFSKDWEHPTADKPWKYPFEWVYTQIMLDGLVSKQLVGAQYVDQRVRPSGSQNEMRTNAALVGVRTGHLSGNWLTKKTTTAWTYFEGYEGYYADDWDPAYYPLSFESGLYGFRGMTYGYVMQEKPFQVYVSKGTVGNIAVKLVQGVQIPLIIRFKHERIFEHLRYNSTVRVRVFDDKDVLVGEWLTSQSINGTDSPFWAKLGNIDGNFIKGLAQNKLAGETPGGGLYDGLFNVLGPGYTFEDGSSYGGSCGAYRTMDPLYETVNYVPRSTLMLNLTVCGIPDPYKSGSGGSWGGRYGIDRILAPRTPKTWNDIPYAPYGINGQPLYTGGYYVEVDVVPFGNEQNKWYPPVQGLLYGESVAIDPRTGKLFPWSIPVNHLGPYQQRVHVSLPGAHLGGETSAIFELDHLGLATGTVYTYTWCDDWRTTSWVQVQFSGAPGIMNYYTFDGKYEAYVPAGTWQVNVIPWLSGANSPGYAGQSMTIAVSDGQAAGYNVYLEESGVPVPEFPTALVVLASALAAALSILRRRRK